MPKNAELEALLDFDPIDSAEKFLGERRTDASNMLGLALAMKHGDAKRAMLERLDDTKFSNTMADAIRIVEREGFQLLLTIPFTGKGYRDEPDTAEEFRIYWNPELSALLNLESYRTDSLNTGKVHFAWKANEGVSPFPPQCSGGCEGESGNYTFVGDYDIREAFVYRLNRMKETGTFVKQWPKTPFLWLLHWMDTKDEGYDHAAITRDRMMQLPQYVRDAMGYV